MRESSISITVDIEDWYHIPSICGSSFSQYKDTNEFFKNWHERYDYLSSPTKRILDILDDFNISATFFVVGDVSKNYPGLIESIADRGHELACHGLHHNCMIDQKSHKALISISQFREDTIETRKILESFTRKKVTGYRAPNALIAGWMIDELEALGFTYDSSVSVNSLYNKTDSSLQGVTTKPYYPEKKGLNPGERRQFIEFPWAYLGTFMKIPASGGPALRFFGARAIIEGQRQSLKRGHSIFYFHPIDISEEIFPRLGNNRPLYWAVKGKTVERRIIRVLQALKNVKKVRLNEVAESLL